MLILPLLLFSSQGGGEEETIGQSESEETQSGGGRAGYGGRHQGNPEADLTQGAPRNSQQTFSLPASHVKAKLIKQSSAITSCLPLCPEQHNHREGRLEVAPGGSESVL